ncbi:uncharacterized protein LOC126371992 [Pectinophora gossypiella]|uniref:uncharacterized protein LOC126371992 n=1 Tax=Pectinophora gossypiella TaxID=13191 RepID=UPI00214E4FC9|nr:uncharacterized protein LOC126371992 [Pectinophora gossypiella]
MYGPSENNSETSLKSVESRTSRYDDDDDITSLSSEFREEESIRWINIIFLPFQLWWQVLVLCAVLIKCFMGPLMAIFPIVRCSSAVQDVYYNYLEFTYRYVVDSLYIIDIFLHIIHRQVTDEAMKREHLPKPAYQIILDVLSMIPLYTMIADDICSTNQMWPNLLSFNEFLLIYRVAKFFSLNTSHNYGVLLIGYSVMFALVINALSCFFILSTFDGLCGPCNSARNDWYDWRKGRQLQIQHSKNRDLALYMYGFSFVTALIANSLYDSYTPVAYMEIVLFNLLMVLGFIFIVFILAPKLFAESLLRLKRLYAFHPRVKRIIEETKRRNPSPSAYLQVELFYSLIWTKRHGIITMPKTIYDLPEAMRLDIKQDLVWPVFHHSPTFRKSTLSYKRWLCQHISLNYKQPGERFFTGPHCYSKLYYIKAGIVQLLSSDDTTSALLSVSGGTLFGDISFLVPPMNRKVIARCLTYCEVLSIARADIVTSLHKFPEDRHIIMGLCRERLKHAHDLYNNKEKKKGADRAEDEGIAWVKRRWWEIFHIVHKLKFASRKKKQIWELPAEESNYHCSKYIGQLVLCEDIKLQRKSFFVKVTFPWILAPDSQLGHIWRQFVLVTVALVLIILPPNIIRQKIETVTCQFASIDENIFYGSLCIFTKQVCVKAGYATYGIYSILVGWVVKGIIRLQNTTTINDIVLAILITIGNLLVNMFIRFKLISALYLKYRERINYQIFVTNLKNHYNRLKIHPNLLKRLDTYLDCHWRYYNGMDILHPNVLKDEPFDIYWKLHGDKAEKIISESAAFLGADTALIKELAHKSKFLILPQNSTLVMFGVDIENVTWISSGVIKCEYHDDKGEACKLFIPNGHMLAMPAVFLGRPPLRTYSSASDVEVLYIKIHEFFSIIQRYPVQWSYFKKCEEELGPTYDKMFISYLKKHKDYQKSLRQRVFHARQSIGNIIASKTKIFTEISAIHKIQMPSCFKDFRTNPESTLLRYWMSFRAIVVFVSIIASTMAGASLRGIYEPMMSLRNVCNGVRVIDIPYYNERGLVISKISKCALHYLARSFVVDIISIVFGWPGVARHIFAFKREDMNRILQMGAEYFTCYSQALLILAYRGDTLFQHGIGQLKSFLTGERVEKHVIHKAVDHFTYWWRRTAGVDMKILMNERVGVVFRQDLSYYFFKRTFQAVDTLLHGGESLERQLASCTSELYHLQGEDIVREMDLCPNLFIVHRGRISITRNNVQIAVLSKGSIIGQLDGAKLRPIRITARALTRADLLVIPVNQFQEMLTPEVRKHISSNLQSKFDYMGLKKALPENPYNSIEYLLRGSKVIKLPWMYEPGTAETNKWYARWLLLVWAICPIVTAAAVIMVSTFVDMQFNVTTSLIMSLDILHVAYLYTEFYTMELVVEGARCEYKYNRLKKLKSVWIYIDVLSLVLPYSTMFLIGGGVTQLARLLRMYTVYFFHRDFCSKFEVVPVTIREMYYKIFAWHLLYLVRLWISSVVLQAVYTKYRHMYHFDYAVHSLLKYLKYNDISLYVRQSIQTYTDLLWKRQSGNWLPEITNQAPFCLREDILSSLYIHHLLTPMLFQNLPMYFLRQLAVKLKRIVIFPGKFIVEEGDIHPCIYFIHEGEVEKWYTDQSGESRMSSVLAINGVFGIIPGLFPNTPYQFSYYTRTVVDLVYLDYYDWQDLLNGYPDVKYDLYVAAMKMRIETSKMSLRSLSKSSLKTPSKTSLRTLSRSGINIHSKMSLK